jgi:hypothetical protein
MASISPKSRSRIHVQDDSLMKCAAIIRFNVNSLFCLFRRRRLCRFVFGCGYRSRL